MNRKQRRAEGKLRKLAAPSPDLREALATGLRHHQSGRLNDARRIYGEILSVDPLHADALHLLGVLAHQVGRLDIAVDLITKAIAQNGQVHAFHSNLGNALKDRGKLDEAITAYRRAIAIKPDSADAYFNLGNALSDQGKLDQAIAAYRRAISIKPDWAAAYSNLGNALTNQGELDEAIIAYRRAIAIKPDYANAYSNLGNPLKNQSKFDEAITAYRRAIAIKPGYAEAYFNLGNALKEQGKLDEAITAYRQATGIKPDYAEAYSNLLICLNLDDKSTADELFAAHREWNERFGRTVSQPAVHANERDLGRRLRIGYVSPDFYQHSVAYFLEPLLERHDRQAMDVFCYAEVKRPDTLTAHLRRLADHWLTTVGLSDDALAERIRADGIDILVDLAGHTADNRLRLFARKPAPVQVTWLGYPNTTGLEAIDYRLVDAVTDPTGEADARASETLVRLEGGFLCYVGPQDAPEPKAPPCRASGIVTFGSFNNPAKISASTLDVWTKLLAGVPEARLLLKGSPFADATARALFLSRLGERGVAAERVELVAWLPSSAAHLALYDRIDIALDPFPYNGTTTTCEALWMGVPVVTLNGDRHAGRVGASLLRQVGLTDLIGNSVDEYVEIALALASNPGRLHDLRRSLRPRLATSSLCNGHAFARKIEVAYRAMWRRWCEAPRDEFKIAAHQTD